VKKDEKEKREEQAGNGEGKKKREREVKKKGIESSDFVHCCTLLMCTMRTLDRTSDVTQI